MKFIELLGYVMSWSLGFLRVRIAAAEWLNTAGWSLVLLDQLS